MHSKNSGVHSTPNSCHIIGCEYGLWLCSYMAALAITVDLAAVVTSFYLLAIQNEQVFILFSCLQASPSVCVLCIAPHKCIHKIYAACTCKYWLIYSSEIVSGYVSDTYRLYDSQKSMSKLY